MIRGREALSFVLAAMRPFKAEVGRKLGSYDYILTFCG